MKQMKRILALTLALALILCLGACGKKEDFPTRLHTAQEKMAELDSYHADMTMDVAMEMTVLGRAQAIDMNVSYSIDVDNAAGVSRMEMTTSSILGNTQNILTYTETVNGETVVYLSTDGGRSWQRQTSAETRTPSDPEQIMELFNRNADSFQITGTETINGSQATVYSGVLEKDYMEEAMEMTGMSESLSGVLGMLGVDDLFADLGEIPMTIAIDDDTGLVVRYTMDMGQVMQKLVNKLFSTLFQSSGAQFAETAITVNGAMSTSVLSQFNSVPEIVIPDAARAA